MMAAENPKLIQDIMQGIQTRCGGQKTPDEFDFLLAEEGTGTGTETEGGDGGDGGDGGNGTGTGSGDERVDRLKCMIEAVDDAIKESDFQGVWDQTKQDLNTVVERMEACKTEQTRTLKLR